MRPAATVVLMRDRDAGPEVLLLRRNPSLVFYGGAWVFPGGRVDADDHDEYAAAGGASLAAPGALGAARRAAVREAHEEAGLRLRSDALVHFARWVTPPGRPRRFDTHYFIAPAPAGAVVVDDGEVHDHRWMRPEAAMAARARGEIELPAPTFVTLSELSSATSTAAILRELSRRGVREFVPRDIPQPDGGLCYLYGGDAGYEDRDQDASGARHRLWALDSGWRYVPPTSG